ncbi:hypothetical protein JCM6882_003956 [Rhodosporidiobolus microsporus]
MAPTLFSPLDALPPVPSSVLLLLFVGLAFVFRYRDGRAFGTKVRNDLWEPPGARFLLGHLPLLLKHKAHFLELWAGWKEECPPGATLSVTFPGRRLVDVSNPDALQHIQKDNFSNFVKGKTMYDRLSTILGDGIFTVDGDLWHKQRKVTSKVFTPALFRTAISASIEMNLGRMSAILERHAERNEEFDLGDLFFRYTLSSFAEFSFSTDVKALFVDDDVPVPFASAFDTAQVLIERRFTNPFWKITERFDGTNKIIQESNGIINEFVYGIIEEREKEGRNSVSKEEKKEAQNTDLLSLYLALEDEQGEKLSKEQVRDACLNLLLAGRDTTAEALSWCCFHLFRDPQKKHVKRMRAEVEELGDVTYDTHKDYIFLNAVFLETLRLHPSVPRNGWQCLSADILPGGVRMEAGDTALWSDWAMSRDENIWGKDAKEFKPERWIEEDGSLKKESQFKAHFFNGGYRLCLGQTLATFEGLAALALLVRDFDFSLPNSYFKQTAFLEEEGTPRYRGALTLSMDSPLTVRVEKRRTVA